MGFYASVRDSNDASPVEDFSLPPGANDPKGTISGTVRSDSGQPVEGMLVGIGGHNTSPPVNNPDLEFPDGFEATTDASGHYSLRVPAHTYPQLILVPAGGYDGAELPDVTVPANATVTRDVTVRRDWSSLKGLGKVLKDDTKYDNTGAGFGCGLDQLADQNEGTGNSAFNPASTDPDNPHLGPPTAVFELPRTITVTEFGLNPSNTCGDDPSAATKDYTLETSADGVSWTTAVAGAFTAAQIHKLNLVKPTAGATNVRFVRLRSLTPQSAQPGESGADFIDFSEVAVYGTQVPAGTLTATPAAVAAGDAVTLAAGFSDADGDAIASFGWDFDGNGSVDATTTTASTTHAYPAVGTFHPAVTVTDARGGAGSATTTVTVSAKPKSESKPKIGKLPARGKRGKLAFKVRCRTRCTVTASLKMSKALRRQLGLGSRTAARYKHTFKGRSKARTVTLRLAKKVTRAARREHVNVLRLRLSATARTPGGKRAHKTRTVRVRR
jgi:hypothetical protein